MKGGECFDSSEIARQTAYDEIDRPAEDGISAGEEKKTGGNDRSQGEMMNGDTLDRIARFMEREEDRLPRQVSNAMILIALREERDARQRETGTLLEKVEDLLVLLNGQNPDGSDGLVRQVAEFNRFRKGVVWAFSAVVLAFLGGLGMYVFNLVFN